MATPLRYGSTYTATVSGVSDINGNRLASPYVWSFSTASQPSCPCLIWGSSITPSTPASADSSSVELGVKFTPDASGYITAVRFYKGAGNGGTHIGNLWRLDGTHLATVQFNSETPNGWQTANFDSPVPVTGGTTYIASYLAPTGHYAYDAGYFTASNYDNAPLHALQAGPSGGNGVFAYSATSTFPTAVSGRDANYWVDVTFALTLPSKTTPPAVTSTFPSNGAVNVPVAVAPSATFSEAVDPNTISFTLTDSANNPVPGSSAYNSAQRTATFTPASPLAFARTYTATVSGATDLYGNVMAAPVTWSFSTPNCPCTIWSQTAAPGTTATSDGNALEVGLKFRADANGYVTGVRFYKGPGNGGTHTGNLWTDSGTRLATVTFTNETATGWQSAGFGNAIAVTAGTIYVISYYAPQGHYAYDSHAFTSGAVDSPPLHALQASVDGGNGVYAYASSSTFPSVGSPADSNYWVDPVFEPAPAAPSTPALAAQSPPPGSSGVPLSSPVAATFNAAVQPASISFSLVDASSKLVAGSTSYDPISHKSTFQPASALTLATTYTATVAGATDLGGHPMSGPVSWSFTTVTSPCPCSLWSTAVTPGTAASADANGVELGLQFSSDVAGHVTGVRFYKGAGNSGTHVAHLWDASGQLLASATFTSETASGWQQVNFSVSVAISPATLYTVSYYAPNGHYAYDGGYFNSGYNNAPLHASSANGSYMYGLSGTYPSTKSPAHGNYWVDVVLAP
jgi:hypothetical protein